MTKDSDRYHAQLERIINQNVGSSISLIIVEIGRIKQGISIEDCGDKQMQGHKKVALKINWPDSSVSSVLVLATR